MDYKELLKIPTINKKAICLSDDPTLAAIISSYFNTAEEYLCVLEAPRVKRPDWTNEVIKKNNVAALLHPEKIILANLDYETINKIKKYLPSHRLIIIDSEQEVESKLKEIGILKPQGILVCKSKDIVYGLLIAKYEKKRLIVDENAKDLSSIDIEKYVKGKHVVILDDLEEMSPVITANYAFAINSKVTYDGYFQKYNIEAEFATFITKGMPYGYFCSDIPSTHYFSYPDLGVQFFNNIYYSSEIKYTRNALILDPGFFAKSEVPVVKGTLMDMGIHVKTLSGNEAKVFNTRLHIEFYPHDLLFICSHAGPMQGDLVTAKFPDKDGEKHTIVIEEALGFGLTGEGVGMQSQVEALHFMKFVEIDGIDWSDYEGRKKAGVHKIIEDFLKVSREKWEILSSVPLKRGIKECPAIKVTDNYLIPMDHSVAAQENPIIFNNAYVSFREMAGRFIFAGARAYIGTLDSVDTKAAQEIAEYIFENLSTEKPLSIVLWEAQRKIYDDPIKRVYIQAGAHFTNIVKPDIDTFGYIKNKVKNNLGKMLDKYFRQILPEDVKRNIGKAIKFLGQLDREFNSNKSEEI